MFRIIIAMLLLAAPLANAAKRPPETAAQKQARAEALRDFVSACVDAFKKSQGESIAETATDLCQCTADEAGGEKISPERLRAETEQISRDPKYKLQDKLLLQSLHICTADAMIDADHRSHEAEKQR